MRAAGIGVHLLCQSKWSQVPNDCNSSHSVWQDSKTLHLPLFLWLFYKTQNLLLFLHVLWLRFLYSRLAGFLEWNSVQRGIGIRWLITILSQDPSAWNTSWRTKKDFKMFYSIHLLTLTSFTLAWGQLVEDSYPFFRFWPLSTHYDLLFSYIPLALEESIFMLPHFLSFYVTWEVVWIL